ncbi:hypothetical protein L2E82_16235 [Cichorium intybus]|uniref:Uncharacterized protein n=1 Tax=Cichorium intybus TaxID=13427 RepID=A0ACB9F5K2_CICIN|nr:hypothetical protein L2E82_16235 [Cichorium intybus]
MFSDCNNRRSKLEITNDKMLYTSLNGKLEHRSVLPEASIMKGAEDNMLSEIVVQGDDLQVEQMRHDVSEQRASGALINRSFKSKTSLISSVVSDQQQTHRQISLFHPRKR